MNAWYWQNGEEVVTTKFTWSTPMPTEAFAAPHVDIELAELKEFYDSVVSDLLTNEKFVDTVHRSNEALAERVEGIAQCLTEGRHKFFKGLEEQLTKEKPCGCCGRTEK